jgi:hypothetical protein
MTEMASKRLHDIEKIFFYLEFFLIIRCQERSPENL